MIVGAPGFTGTYVNGGLVLVLYGASTGLSSSSATTLTGTQNLAGLGTAVAGLGDVNSDGYDDVAISEPWYDTVNILLGSSTGLTLTGATTVSVNNYYYFGTSVDGAGDVNGDGAPDLIVGEPAYSSTRTAELGRAYIFHNSGSGTFSSPRGPSPDRLSRTSSAGTWRVWGCGQRRLRRRARRGVRLRLRHLRRGRAALLGQRLGDPVELLPNLHWWRELRVLRQP